MNLLVLLIILIGVFLVYLMSCTTTEFLTPSPYQISWGAPQNPGCTGSECKCCTYEWQICTDPSCTNIVDSGQTPLNVTSALTYKLDWNTTYSVRIRAINSFGESDWFKTGLTTGDGILSSITIAGSINNGTITPVGIGTGIAVSTTLTGEKETGAVAFVTLNVVRGSITFKVYKSLLIRQAQSGVFETHISSDGLSNILTSLAIGDIINVDFLVTTSDRLTVISEITGSTTISGGVASPITSIAVNYSPKNPILTNFQPNNSGQYGGNTLGSPIQGSVGECQNECQLMDTCDFFVYTPVTENTGNCILQRFHGVPNTESDGWTGSWQTTPGIFVTRQDAGNLNDPNVADNAERTANSAEDCLNQCNFYNNNETHSDKCLSTIFCYDGTKCNAKTCKLHKLNNFNTQGEQMYIVTQSNN